MSDQPSIISDHRLTSAQRRALYAVVTAQRQSVETVFAVQMRRINRRFAEDCAKDPTPSGIDRAIAVYEANLGKAYRRMALAYLPIVERLLTGSKQAPMETKGISKRLRAWLDTYCANRITKVSDGTKSKVRRLYADAGGDISRFEQSLNTQFSAKRSELIARTECGITMNTAITEQAKDYSFGQKMDKEWVHSGMSNARATHQALDGVTIDSEAKFDVEDPYTHQIDHMRYPCDPEVNNPRNCCNCRCTISFRYRWD